MLRAVELAKKGLGFTSPNPAVGAVVVQGHMILGEGYHKKAGEAHAESIAIAQARKQGTLEDATLYVTLEPCCHSGKTPPCTSAVIDAGISHVVYGMRDPFSKVNGKGERALREAGVNVSSLSQKDPLYDEVRLLNQWFIKKEKTGLPFVTLKIGMSLDGKIATAKGDSKWITGIAARKDARLERSRHDAVLVGAGTVEVDNPELAAHGTYKKKKLLRVVIDPDLKSNPASNIFRDEHVFVATTERAPRQSRTAYEKKGIEYAVFGKQKVAITKLLRHLSERGIKSVFVEGGSRVHGSFCDAAREDKQVIDQILFYIAPKIVGGNTAPSVVGGVGPESIKDALKCKNTFVEKVGSDLKVRGVINWY